MSNLDPPATDSAELLGGSGDNESTTGSCEHCDDSTPHSHIDEGPLIEAYRRSWKWSSVTVLVLTILAMGALLVWHSHTTWPLFLGLLSWGVAIVVGLAAVGLVRRHRKPATAIVAGAMANAAITVLLAWLVAALSPATLPVTALALAGSVGWLLLGGIGAIHQAFRLASILHEPTRAGEAARDAVVRSRGKPSPLVECGWLVATALIFGGYVAALAMMPALIVALVPFNVALAILTRRWMGTNTSSQG
ncbi:MAG: hypothetical protein ACK5KU_05120 [Beutenbergiaceae bacterium]